MTLAEPAPDLLEAALTYAARGWPVFPVRPGGKVPLTSDGFKSASTDPATIRRWWTAEPLANVGLYTGGAGLLVVDLDRPKRDGDPDGVATMTALTKEHGVPPPSPRTRTPSGGLHLYFKDPGGIAPRAGALPGVDTRTAGSYVVAPPSQGADGTPYAWVHDPETAPLADCPEWLTELLRGANERERTAPRATGADPLPAVKVQEIRSALASIPADNREDWLRVGMALESTGAGPQAFGLWTEWAQTSEKYDPADQRRTWDSFKRDGVTLASLFGLAREHGWTPPPRKRETGKDAAQAHEEPPPEWPPVLPLESPHREPWPEGVLPAPLEAFVDEVAESYQVPRDFPGVTVLGVLAAASQRVAEIEIKADWREVLALQAAILAESGDRKTASEGACVDPLWQWEQAEAERTRVDRAKAANRYDVLKRRLDAAKKAAAVGKATLDDVDRAAEELARAALYAAPKLIAQDCTAERLAGICAEQGGCIAVFSSEAEPFEAIAGKYSKNGGANLDVWLKGYSGQHHRVDRVGRDGEDVECMRITACLAVQPAILRRIGENAEYLERGFTARWVYSLPLSLVGRRRIETVPVSARTRDAYQRAVETILNLRPPAAGGLHKIHLGADARETFLRFADGVEQAKGPGGTFSHLRSWAEKFAGNVARIAALLHIAKTAPSGWKPWETDVELPTVQEAIRIGHYLAAHAEVAHEVMGAAPELRDAVYLWARLEQFVREDGDLVLRHQDVWQRTKNKFGVKADRLADALEVLVLSGRVRLLRKESTGGRTPAPDIEVNPVAFELCKKGAFSTPSTQSLGRQKNIISLSLPESPLPKEPGTGSTQGTTREAWE